MRYVIQTLNFATSYKNAQISTLSLKLLNSIYVFYWNTRGSE